MVNKDPQPLYTHTQTSVPFNAIFGAGVVIILVFVFATNFHWIPVLAFLVVGLFLIFFHSLTVKVDTDRVKIFFGPAWFGETILLDNIDNLCVTRLQPIDGLGVHWTRQGWVYNVTGLGAVELDMKDGSIIRIGSDEPEQLARGIENALIQRRRK
jgi:hypothetical protein